MADTIATISDDNTTITITSEQGFITVAGVDNTISVSGSSITNAGDIDTLTNGLEDGSLLVYKTASSKWVATTTLEEQEITGGQY